MKNYIDQLKTYIADHPPIISQNNFDSILDALYWCYAESNQLENEKIEEYFEVLYHRLTHLCIQDIDQIMDVVYALCIENQCLSFCAGIRVGICLSQELSV